jgi:hypothetical protein
MKYVIASRNSDLADIVLKPY